MILTADESVDRQIVERLRADGHDVAYVAELSPSISDQRVLSESNSRRSILVTADKDFGELVFRQGQAHEGVVLLRLVGLSALAKAQIISKALRDHAADLPGAFSVIRPQSIRVRTRL